MDNIAIVGCGIGGLATAIFLARKGFEVTLFDKAENPEPVGAGFLLQPPGQQVLDALGVLSQVKDQSVTIRGLQSQTLSGRSLLDLEYANLRGKPRHGLGVHRNTIFQALFKEAQRQENIVFNWSSYIESVREGENRVELHVNAQELAFDICILSSGSNSSLARQHFPTRICRPYGWGCLWTTFSLPQQLSPHILHQRCLGSQKMMGILPIRKRDSHYDAALYWSMKSNELAQFTQSKFAALKDELIQFWPTAEANLASLSYDDFIAANYNDIWTPTPFRRRLIAIGDISHATSPQLGQGCTMALLDAYTLAQHLHLGQTELNAALVKWWACRKPQLRYVRHLSRFLTPLFQSEQSGYALFRDWVMAPAGRLPVLRDVQLKTLAADIFLKGLDN